MKFGVFEFAMFTVNCAGCDRPLNLPEDAYGKVIRCLHCSTIIMVRGRQGTDQDQDAKREHTTVIVQSPKTETN